MFHIVTPAAPRPRLIRWPSPRSRLIPVVLAIVLLLPAAMVGASRAVARQPASECDTLVRSGVDYRPMLGDVSCGTLTVPENWFVPDGRQLSISYVVLRSTSPDPAPDPVVYLEGGPGGSALQRAPAYARTFARLREERDVILFDQRGTGRSSPLECARFESFEDLFGAFRGEEDVEPAVDAAGDALAEDDPDAVLAVARASVLPDTASCAQELFTRGIDLTQYNSRASANDVVAVVKALGYNRYNLYGISYGTRLALVVMRDHADSGLRSVVLDSTYPPNEPGYEQTPTLPYQVAMQVFADCAISPSCNAAYPNLRNRVVSLLNHMERDPITTAEGITVTADDVIDLLRSIANDVRMVPYLPRMIDELEQDRAATYLGIVSGELFAAEDAARAAATDPDSPPARQASESSSPATVAATAVPPADGEQSTAELWLDLVEERAQTLAGDYATAALQLLLMLDKLPRERETLTEFVDRAFVGDDQAATREALRAAIDAMSDDDIQAVFTLIGDAPDLLDAGSVGINLAMFNSVECHEAIRFESFQEAAAAAAALPIPDLAAPLEVVAEQFVRCEVWPSGTAPDIEGEAVVSDIPTLMMAGAYDVQTPISWSKLVFLTLPNAYWAFFPMSGHGTIFFSTCSGEVSAAFVDRPDLLPDLSCTTDLEPAFVLPEPDRPPA